MKEGGPDSQDGQAPEPAPAGLGSKLGAAAGYIKEALVTLCTLPNFEVGFVAAKSRGEPVARVGGSRRLCG